MLNGLGLFEGIGGLTIALQEWVQPVAYCEKERYCQAQLLSRMAEGLLPAAPIWDDIETLFKDRIESPIDIIYGGFPCQDISCAGTGKGLDGKRSGLFWELYRLVEEIKPSFVFLENVPAIRTRGMEILIKKFTDVGYDCRWTCVSAAEVGAPHLRKRWFFLAHAKRSELWEQPGRSSGKSGEDQAFTGLDGQDRAVADSSGAGRRNSETLQEGSKQPGIRAAACSSWWDIEPNVGRVADGVSRRLDRVKGLGNSVVPLQAKTAFERLMGI